MHSTQLHTRNCTYTHYTTTHALFFTHLLQLIAPTKQTQTHTHHPHPLPTTHYLLPTIYYPLYRLRTTHYMPHTAHSKTRKTQVTGQTHTPILHAHRHTHTDYKGLFNVTFPARRRLPLAVPIATRLWRARANGCERQKSIICQTRAGCAEKRMGRQVLLVLAKSGLLLQNSPRPSFARAVGRDFPHSKNSPPPRIHEFMSVCGACLFGEVDAG